MLCNIDRARLWADQRGAMIIMGIPMAMLMIGFLYFVIGLGEQIIMRERLQDAADAAAFSAAIMHARGMNMIALVNQVMAAIVAVLVMVRLFQALMIAVAAIAAALAFWTAGASLSVVPPATQAASQAQTAFETLRGITTPILRGLHVFELGLKYGMPVAAEARVIDTVSGHYRPPASVGFAIPGHYPLPVQDGQWSELCGEAGRYAGRMITWPVDAVIGDNIVSDVIGSGIEGLATRFAAVFCDPSAGSSPNLSIPTALPEVQLDQAFDRGIPETATVARCNTRDSNVTLAQREAWCDEAALEQGRAAPDPDGGPNTTCMYHSVHTNQSTPCEPCRGPSGEACSEFTTRATSAASACRPGGDIEANTWTYQRRDYTHRINLVPVPLPVPGEGESLEVPSPEDRLYTIELVGAPSYRDRLVDRVPQPPCGPGGQIATRYNASSSYQQDGRYSAAELLCEQVHLEPDTDAWVDEAGPGSEGLSLREWRQRFNHATWNEHSEADYEPARPRDWDPNEPWPPPYLQPPFVPEERPYFVGQWAAATFLHSCTVRVESAAELDLPPDDVNAQPPPAADSSSCGQGQQVHHTMEPGHALGSETFQLRAVVFGESQREVARNVVERVPFRVTGQTRGAGGLVSGVADVASRVFVAQAEYYFDTGWDARRERPELTSDRWMWSMSWRARLRRFRLPRDEDEPSREPAPDSASSCGFEAPALDVEQACSVAGGACGGGFLERLQELAETVMVH